MAAMAPDRNTIVVPVRVADAGRASFAALFSSVGFVAGLLVALVYAGGQPWPQPSPTGFASGSLPAPSVAAPPTRVIVVLMPTPQPTATPTPTPAPTKDTFDPYDPARSTPGGIYRQTAPTALAPTPPPLPVCGSEALAAGSLCVAPTVAPTAWGEG